MLCNVIDNRHRRYRWESVNAVIEVTWHDNGCDDADLAEPGPDETDVVYEARRSISVSEAVQWANAQTCAVTLYLYDEGEGL